AAVGGDVADESAAGGIAVDALDAAERGGGGDVARVCRWRVSAHQQIGPARPAAGTGGAGRGASRGGRAGDCRGGSIYFRAGYDCGVVTSVAHAARLDASERE